MVSVDDQISEPGAETGRASRQRPPRDDAARDERRDRPQMADDRERAREGKAGPEPDDRERKSLRETIRKHPAATAAAAVAALLALAAGAAWWLQARHFVSTDDAFIDARIATISSQVAGEVTELPVTDNQAVNAGATLVRIDDRDYRNALAQAKAQVEQTAASVANLDAQIEAQNTRIVQAKDQVAQARAALTFAEQEDARAQDLFAKQAGTKQAAQQTSSNLRQAQSSLAAAEANQAASEKQVTVLRTQRATAVGQLDQARATQSQAETNLARTSIKAPTDGFVTKISVAKGNYAQPGQALFMFVPHEMWVTANFKETQLTDMRPSQPVDISIDTYLGRTFHGHVDTLQSGSGSVFSLLPAENATGNYVKVVQRVPVKIVFDERPDVFIGPGMSVVPTVRVQ